MAWWWLGIAVGLLVFWGGAFPSFPSRQPVLDVVTNVAAVVGMVMLAVGLGVVVIDFWRRRGKG